MLRLSAHLMFRKQAAKAQCNSAAADEFGGDAARLRDYADRAFIGPPKGTGCWRSLVVACEDEGFEPDLVHQVDDYPTAVHLVGAGLGVAMVTDLGLVHTTDRVRALDLHPPISRTVELAYRTTSAERPAIVAIRQTLLEVVAHLALVPAAA